MKRLIILCLFLSSPIGHTKKSKNQWKSLKKDLLPVKKKAQHIVKEESDSFDDIRKQTKKEYEAKKRELINKNKNALTNQLKSSKSQGQEKDKLEDQKYLDSLQSQGQTNIKLWLKTQRYLKQVQEYLIHL